MSIQCHLITSLRLSPNTRTEDGFDIDNDDDDGIPDDGDDDHDDYDDDDDDDDASCSDNKVEWGPLKLGPESDTANPT